MVAALAAADIRFLVKIPTVPANAELTRRFGAAPGSNTLVFCGPNDEVIVRLLPSQCSAQNALILLGDFKARYDAWLKLRANSMPAQIAVVKAAAKAK